MVYTLPKLLVSEEEYAVNDNKDFMKNLKNPSNLKLLKNINYDDNYCFNYAFNDNCINTCEEAQEILDEDYFIISLDAVEAGDIVSFYQDDLANTLHFAIVAETNGTLEGIRIKSKWGNGGIFKSDLQMLPESYGTKIKFWRKY